MTTYSQVNQIPALFPAVAFCNLNPYENRVARNEIESSLVQKNLSINNYNSAIKYMDDSMNQIKSSMQYKSRSNTLNSSIQNYGFLLENMLISCRFQGVACSHDDFSSFNDYDYGNCYRFNHNASSLKLTQKPGQDNGLRLELFVGIPDVNQRFVLKSGVRVIIHNQSITPFPDEDGIDVSAGKQTNIAIGRVFVNRLPDPFSDCIDNLDLNHNKNLALQYIEIMSNLSNSKYNQKYCLKLCLQQYVISKCNCYDLSLPFSNHLNSSINGCYESHDTDCSHIKEIEFFNSNEIGDCYKKCPIECETMSFSTKITTADYPSLWYYNILRRNDKFFINNTNYPTLARLPYEQLKLSILMINVYYEDGLYTRISEAPELTIELLISFVGGNLGLFLGISLLSLIEIVEVFLNFIILSLKNIISKSMIKYT